MIAVFETMWCECSIWLHDSEICIAFFPFWKIFSGGVDKKGKVQ